MSITLLDIRDKEELQSQIDELKKNVFGYVDENNNIVISANLPNGTYTLKYENDDGTYTEIGTLEVGEVTPDAPSYTNLADTSDENWKENIRIKSDYSETATSAEGMATTNFIAATKGDVIRVKGMTFGASANERVVQYINTATPNNAIVSTVNTDLYSISGDITIITLDGSPVISSGTLIRICGTLTGTSDDVIITINEEIV